MLASIKHLSSDAACFVRDGGKRDTVGRCFETFPVTLHCNARPVSIGINSRAIELPVVRLVEMYHFRVTSRVTQDSWMKCVSISRLFSWFRCYSSGRKPSSWLVVAIDICLSPASSSRSIITNQKIDINSFSGWSYNSQLISDTGRRHVWCIRKWKVFVFLFRAAATTFCPAPGWRRRETLKKHFSSYPTENSPECNKSDEFHNNFSTAREFNDLICFVMLRCIRSNEGDPFSKVAHFLPSIRRESIGLLLQKTVV